MRPGSAVTILDGGMGRQLERMGAPFRLPEWSALALIEAPQFVSAAHAAFIRAGAEVISTNTYGLAPSRIGEARFAAEGRRLADIAGSLAREAAAGAASVRVAGSLPPVFESYRPDLFDASQAPAILDVLVAGLTPHVDLWLIETQSSTAEADVAMAAARPSGLPIWISFTLRDEVGRTGPAQLRSGESVEQAVAFALRRGASAILFNCSQPEVMDAAVRGAVQTIDRSGSPGVPVGVYANGFAAEALTEEPYAGISELRDDLGPDKYVEWARRWVQSGATLIGGCCGIGPLHIAALSAHFR